MSAPILGDDLYSNTEPSKDIISSTEIPPNRMYLHAHETSFFVTFPHLHGKSRSLTLITEI